MPLSPPDALDADRRVAVTLAVRDTDPIPKVADAGEVRDHAGRRVQVMHNGLLIEEGCYGGEFETRIIEGLRGHHEPQEELVFHRLLERLTAEGAPESRVMVELGAFWAYYSMWFQKALPGATTIMVEPDPHTLEVGRRNFELNALDGDFLQAAVGFRDGAAIWLQCESDGRSRRVPTVTVGGLLESRGLTKCDLLLCDTQGAETEVLRAALPALGDGQVRFIVVSTHHQFISGDPLTHQRCLALVQDAGGHIIAEHSVSESASGDGLIVASFDPRDADFSVDITRVRARDSLFGEPEFVIAAAPRLRDLPRRQAGRVYRAVQRRTRRVR